MDACIFGAFSGFSGLFYADVGLHSDVNELIDAHAVFLTVFPDRWLQSLLEQDRGAIVSLLLVLPSGSGLGFCGGHLAYPPSI